ncbi:hypothetical protein [Planococcus shenhongbingii]|uniref:Uncharacterized protein n=1 Tax=Planococcus shenhongbingii TaxID=3058398 RepID=A0ABT8NGJ1_9BACL|nr:hypothetical protein [Planococcus sp. N017]MDN7246936.1 hypothetical protein [Planococcus sp. N017]
MNKTATGVNFLNLSDESVDFQEMILDAERCYPTFNFRHKVETIIFYTERSDFGRYIWKAYGMPDRFSGAEKSAHYPLGNKSVIGVEVYSGLTKSLLTYEMGHAVEHYRLQMDFEKYGEWKDRDGYFFWSEFFCQAHASFERKKSVHENDIYLNELPFYLEARNEMFNEENIRRTYLALIRSMSDLFYYVDKGDEDAIHLFLERFERMTHEPFMELYDELFNYLMDYFKKYGKDYSKPHRYKFFEILEDYKEEFTDYFFKHQL